MDSECQYGPRLTRGRREKTLSGLRTAKDKHYKKGILYQRSSIVGIDITKTTGKKGAKHSSVDGFQVECDFCCPCF